MGRKYKSKTFQDMYDNFNKMFQQEGDCYDTIRDSLNEDYEHGKLPGGTPKMVVLNVLKDVTVDFYTDKIKVLTEDQYIKK